MTVLCGGGRALVASRFSEGGLTKTGLARRLAVPDTEARRLLDLDYPTKMDRLERVRASFGVELVVITRKPAA